VAGQSPSEAPHALELLDQPPAPAAPPKAEERAPFVPYEIELPEGVALDGEPMTEFQQFARTNNMSSEVVQGLINRHVTALTEASAAAEKRQWDAYHNMTKGWLARTMADPDYGGSRFRTSQATANKILSELTPAAERKELGEILTWSGLDNHPLIFRLLMRMHARLAMPPAPAATPPADAKPSSAREPPTPATRYIRYAHPRGGQ
jgi:hypothetical protein